MRHVTVILSCGLALVGSGSALAAPAGPAARDVALVEDGARASPASDDESREVRWVVAEQGSCSR